jgi:hypothetical protein
MVGELGQLLVRGAVSLSVCAVVGALCWWIPVDAGGKSRAKGAADRLVQGKPLRRKGQGQHAALARQERASFQRLAAIISRAQVLV